MIHPEQLATILTQLSGYNVGYFPDQDLDPDQSAYDAIIGAINSPMGNHTMESEKYSLKVKGASLTTLETMQAALRKCSSGYSTGYHYNSSMTGTVTLSAADRATYKTLGNAVQSKYANAYDTWEASMSNGGFTTMVAVDFPIPSVLLRVLSIITTVSSVLHVLPHGGTIPTEDVPYIYGRLTDTVASAIPSGNVLSTYLDTGVQSKCGLFSSWTVATDAYAAIIDGSANAILSQLQKTNATVVKIAEFEVFLEAKTIDAQQLTITYTIPTGTDFPFWIDVHPKRKWYNEQSQHLELEIEGRWSL